MTGQAREEEEEEDSRVRRQLTQIFVHITINDVMFHCTVNYLCCQ